MRFSLLTIFLLVALTATAIATLSGDVHALLTGGAVVAFIAALLGECFDNA